MRFSQILVGALATTATASSWFGKAAYNKWHETELERWLSDHSIPYPTPADRKDLENLVKSNWQSTIVDPLAAAGDKTTDSYESVKDWIFDSWTESQLKAFLDHNNIPAPQPRARDSYLTSARQNYDSVAKKLGEYSAYPGDWLYSSWTESDLKEFLDSRGWPAPQPSTRDKLIASVRRNSRLASLSFQSAASSASASAESAQASLSDALFDAWSDSKLKEFLDSHGVPVPQGSKKNELIALARKHRAQLTGNEASSVSSGAASAYGAATSSAGNAYAKATDSASAAADDAFYSVVDTWGESRLKAFLDARGVPVPQGSKKNELVKQVRLNKHKAQSGWSAWTFDTWTVDNLQKYLKAQGKDTKKTAKASRDDLVKQAQDAYASASKTGGSNYASATNYLAQQTDAAKDTTFDTWSESELKKYLDGYGISNYQGTTLNELRAEARKQYNYFKYGTSTPSGTIYERIKSGLSWVLGYVSGPVQSGSAQASKSASSAASIASKHASSAKSEL
ncbi:Meiotic sister chromatid recombination protein 1 [Cyphellophora attinorum]|uniref:Meiotic sister chromatid recombination protein 1 n=1 Tax=Cyphellophora attinorum TaxID=1664694 RepID=A0A0N0NQG6_9EURO|nr:Meiotic sister chromatid recombination protein 1 [Phialophora attinorum]KPI43679.1 Meiotic sister chromatid recombination protein 1 [Phialophora attinorum]